MFVNLEWHMHWNRSVKVLVHYNLCLSLASDKSKLIIYCQEAYGSKAIIT